MKCQAHTPARAPLSSTWASAIYTHHQSRAFLKGSRVNIRRSLWSALPLMLLMCGESTAQSSDDARVQKLEETVQALERRVASLEAQLRDRSTSANSTPANANWRGLKIGMRESDVEQLLGRPSKIDTSKYLVTWYYNYPLGGSVNFGGETRTVERWSEP
jgi:hypothetical protein